MRTKLVALAVLTALAVTLAAVAGAGPVAPKQRVAIKVEGGASFVLTPLTPGAIKPDAGAASFCCWTERHTIRNGQAVDVNNPQMTLMGKRGTLVARNEIGFVDLPGGWAIFTGTWKVVRATGAYAGLVGGGGGAGASTPNGRIRSQFEGFLGPR
jgi:hypothetical protein